MDYEKSYYLAKYMHYTITWSQNGMTTFMRKKTHD